MFEEPAADADAAPEIATITIAPQTAALQSTFPATIKGKTDIDIRPQVTGFITKVHVDEGQHVRKGQVLFTLDQVTFQAAVDQARAAVNNAQTAVNTAKMTADSKRLFSTRTSSANTSISSHRILSRRHRLSSPTPRPLSPLPRKILPTQS